MVVSVVKLTRIEFSSAFKKLNDDNREIHVLVNVKRHDPLPYVPIILKSLASKEILS